MNDEIDDLLDISKKLIKNGYCSTTDSALNIANGVIRNRIEHERNLILRSAFVVTDGTTYPSALEKIAIEMEAANSHVSSLLYMQEDA